MSELDTLNAMLDSLANGAPERSATMGATGHQPDRPDRSFHRPFRRGGWRFCPYNPNAPKVAQTTVRHNTEKNGVEVYFPAKPTDSVRAALKGYGFRWSGHANCWYARYNPVTVDAAERIAGVKIGA